MSNDRSRVETATRNADAAGTGHPEGESDHRGDPGPRPLRIGDRIIWRMSKGKSTHPGQIVSLSEKGYDWRLKIDAYEIEIHAFEQELTHEATGS